MDVIDIMDVINVMDVIDFMDVTVVTDVTDVMDVMVWYVMVWNGMLCFVYLLHLKPQQKKIPM